MAKSSTLLALLGAENEPKAKYYNEAVDDLIIDPRQISGLTEDNVRDDILISLSTHSHRLAQVFHRLRSVVRKMPKSANTYNIAVETVNFLVDGLPYLSQLLEPSQVLGFLAPALDLCFVSSQRPTLQELASVLTASGTLLEHLVSDHLGIEVVRQWASMQNTKALEAGTLELWTERLVTLARNCTIDHDVTHEVQLWHTLQTLKDSLRKLEHNASRQSSGYSGPVTRHDLPALGSMTRLNREDKKAPLAKHRDINSAIPSLQDDDKRSLKIFDIHVPGSKSSLLDVIKRLEGEETTAILLSIASKFPCYLCISGMESQSQTSKGKTREESFQAAPLPQIEVLGKGLGLWKVLLSPQALRSVLHMGSHGIDGPVTDKLKAIASGDWKPEFQQQAGTKSQRKFIRVPVAQKSCGQNQWILWQIAIGTDEETDLPLQEIKVWEVCEYSEISKIIDRVMFLQQSYSDEIVRRCRQHCTELDGMQIPVRFEGSAWNSTKSARPSADLDIRIVDPDIIEMTNKFYALTEPVIRSILLNDLSAEFPFHLSREEASVIRHYRTASLILGRSGTGKTTCLVFKLVGKYLASKAVVDERPVRQVLLTRSPFLVEKLKSYTRRLIETLSSESIDQDSPQQSEHAAPIIVEEDHRTSTVFTLRDQSFPLVCTWDGFLGILESTIKKMVRPEFDDIGEPADPKSDDVTNSIYGQLVDFHTFKVDYWPHFSHALTKDLSVNLVFAEIMGVIKGSASSRDSLAPLRREDYLTRSCRLAPTFVMEAERSRVYDVFKIYEKVKLGKGGVDYVDRVVRLLKAVRRDSSLKQLLRSTFDEVYIDEIQDQRCLDIELLLSFIKDGRGFHFAGDTAQAISQDSTFRFADIKVLFYKHFAAAGAATRQSELARPIMFTLSKNYRSHEGILALASLIMGMIWNGFPETVDKLEPEIGELNGPKPLLFDGIDFNILRSNNVGQSTPSTGTADFGAEQVILVRDSYTKTSLQHQIGDVALILTILESKGMEFDDVILWNFFTDCPDQAGVRSLDTLHNEPASFDPRKHDGMCSELKHLYVAITRARVQLFIMESSKTTTATVLKFLGQTTSDSLVQVTSPSHGDFAMRLEMLRPGTSLDPRQWSRRGAELMHRRMYKDALRCFRKAKDSCGETTAKGHLREEEGRRCNAVNDIEGFIENLTLAVEHFTDQNLINDACRVLVALGKFKDAAEMMLRDKQYSKAARLFVEAGLSREAVDCHHLAKEHSEVAAILNKEKFYDRLVFYLDENRTKIPTNTLRGYSLLCKLLLKQNKTSPEFRKHAIRVLGSLAEQEECFREYGMDEDLAKLYVSQLRHRDLFHLLSRKGHLERALKLAIAKNLLQTSADGLESEVLSLLDYAWVGHLQKYRQQRSAAPLKLPPGFLTPSIILRAKEWEASNVVYSLEGPIARQHVLGMKGTVPKTILCLRKILGVTAITKTTTLDDLPFEMMHEAVNFAKNLTLDKEGGTLQTVLLLTGLWKPANSKGSFAILPWSPLREGLTDFSITNPTKVVLEQVLDRLVSAIFTFDAKARDLWKKKWPKCCVHYVTIGFCPRKRAGEECNLLHEIVSADECSRKLDDLLQMNSFFCGLAVLYYRQSMNEKFLKSYMGIKRYWLERLFRELTYLSSAEQQTSAIIRTQKQLLHDDKFIAVSSFLEALLYYRLGEEWEKRSDFSSLIEQMQLAQVFGPNLQKRVFRRLSYRLNRDKRLNRDRRRQQQQQLGLLNKFKQDLGSLDATAFQSNLKNFLRGLDNIDIQALSTLHAFTAVVEYLATYLILKTCVTACILTQAWIELHVSQLTDVIRMEEPLEWFMSNHMYQQCLMDLTKAFCIILRRLNEAPQSNMTLSCSGRTHPALLLRQRNADLVAIMIANLAPAEPRGLAQLWINVKEVFEYDFVRAYDLKCRTPAELTPKLALSFSKYNGKDALIVVIKDQNKRSPFHNLEHQLSVKTVEFDQICPLTATTLMANQASADMLPSMSLDNPQEEYTTAETEAATSIQRIWRSYYRKINIRRSYMETPEARAVAHFISLSAECPAALSFIDRVTFRDTLISKGVAMSLRLVVARDTLSKLQQDAMTCVENIELSTGLFESIDNILHRNSKVEALLGKAEEKMSEECMRGLVRMGVLTVLEKAMEDIGTFVAEAELEMLQSREMIDRVSRNST